MGLYRSRIEFFVMFEVVQQFIMKTSHKSDELMLFVSILPLYSIFFIGIWNCPDRGIFLFSFISMRYHYIDIAKIRNKKKYLP